MGRAVGFSATPFLACACEGSCHPDTMLRQTVKVEEFEGSGLTMDHKKKKKKKKKTTCRDSRKGTRRALQAESVIGTRPKTGDRAH